MPKAKTGCKVVLYTRLTPPANAALNRLVTASRKVSGWKVSRAVLLDTILLALEEGAAFNIPPPEYKPHAPIKRITSATRPKG